MTPCGSYAWVTAYSVTVTGTQRENQVPGGVLEPFRGNHLEHAVLSRDSCDWIVQDHLVRCECVLEISGDIGRLPDSSGGIQQRERHVFGQTREALVGSHLEPATTNGSVGSED